MPDSFCIDTRGSFVIKSTSPCFLMCCYTSNGLKVPHPELADLNSLKLSILFFIFLFFLAEVEVCTDHTEETHDNHHLTGFDK